MRTGIALAVTIPVLFATRPLFPADPEIGACPRSVARSHPVGEVAVLPAITVAACRLVLERTGVVLSTASSSAVSDIGRNILRKPDGRFLTFSGRGDIGLWSRTGQLDRILGRPGAGPGEFAIGWMNLHLTNDGRLFVRDNTRRWTEFDENSGFLRTFARFDVSGDVKHSVFLDNGLFLAAEPTDEHPHESVSVYEFTEPRARNGEQTRVVLRRSFAPLLDAELTRPPQMRARAIAYGGGDTFWLAPPDAGARGYALEQWTSGGELIRTIRRNVRWLASAPSPGVTAMIPAPQWTLYALGDDLLLVAVAVPKQGANPPPASSGGRGREGMEDAAIDVYYDVIDVRSNEILVSEGPVQPSRARRLLPTGLFKGTGEGYLIETSAEGDRVARIVRCRLIRQ